MLLFRNLQRYTFSLFIPFKTRVNQEAIEYRKQEIWCRRKRKHQNDDKVWYSDNDNIPGREGSQLEQLSHYSWRVRGWEIYTCVVIDGRWRLRGKDLKILIFHSGSQQITSSKKQEMVIHEWNENSLIGKSRNGV